MTASLESPCCFEPHDNSSRKTPKLVMELPQPASFFSQKNPENEVDVSKKKKEIFKSWPRFEKPDLVVSRSAHPPWVTSAHTEGSGSGSKGLLTAWINSYLAFRALISSVALIRSIVADYQQRFKDPPSPGGHKGNWISALQCTWAIDP